MLQREIVRFRASDKLPNPLEVDYWVDTSSNYYGGCIRYYRNDTDTWEMLDINDEQVQQLLDYINKALDLIEQYVNNSIKEIRNELSEFEGDIREEINKLWLYTNQNIENINTLIQDIKNNISGATDADIESLQQLIINIAQLVNELNTNVNSKITELKQYIDSQIGDLKNYIDSLIADVNNSINQEVTDRENAINSLRTELKNYIDNLTGNSETNLSELNTKIDDIKTAIDDHTARRDNPHVVTRAQLSLDTIDNVTFNRVNAPNGFYKE